MTEKQLQAENERLRQALSIIWSWANCAHTSRRNTFVFLRKIAEKADGVLKGDNQ
jgi:hypothetical protein